MKYYLCFKYIHTNMDTEEVVDGQEGSIRGRLRQVAEGDLTGRLETTQSAETVVRESSVTASFETPTRV